MQRGQALGATLIVLLDARERMDTLTIDLEAVTAQNGTSLWKDLFLVTVGSSQDLKSGVVSFAQTLRSKIAPPLLSDPQASAPASRTLRYVTGGGTLVAVGAAVAFGLIGRGQKSRLNEARFTDASTGRASSRLTQAEAERVAGRANLSFNVALSSAVVSAVLGSTTAYLWMKNEPSK
jgi:hypothetical protein